MSMLANLVNETNLPAIEDWNEDQKYQNPIYNLDYGEEKEKVHVYNKFWYIDEHPDQLDRKNWSDMTGLKKGMEHGYYTKEGWVSWRGRRISYPKSVDSKGSLRKYKLLEKDLYYKVRDDIYYPLRGNIFQHHNAPQYDYLYGEEIIIFVPVKIWKNMGARDRWEYLQDLDVDGWNHPYEEWAKYEAALRAQFPIDMANTEQCARNWRWPEHMIQEYAVGWANDLEDLLTPRHLCKHDIKLFMSLPSPQRWSNGYHDYFRTGLHTCTHFYTDYLLYK